MHVSLHMEQYPADKLGMLHSAAVDKLHYSWE